MCRRAVLAGLVTLGLAGAARAQTVDPEAEHQRGIALRNEHRDAEALVVFRGLYERSGEVRALARMALAEAALSRWADSEAHLQRALSTDDAWVTQNRASLDVALATVRQHLGSLTVHANVPGAEVFVGGQRAATVPFERPLRVPDGTMDIEVRAAGHVTARRTVTVRPGVEVTALDVELAAAPPEAPAAAVVPEPAPSLQAPIPEVLPPVVDPQERRAREQRRATWETLASTGLVLGGVGFLTSAIALGVRESAVTTFNDNLCGLVSESPPTFAGGRDCSAQYNRAEAATAISLTGLVAGAVFTAAGAAAWYVATRSAPSHAVACAPTLHQAGVVCGGSF
ncbi:MAG: PEGA domain-containing protein [Deltaproteobacteria bacterium]|nr:PEGA domain-containing protein [Myxococcales bacterium]MDP3219432.1 PEGA domain-containing protein [Deltaproteobacteria bacterium]